MPGKKATHPDIKIITLGSYFLTEKPCPRIIAESGYMPACRYKEYVVHWTEKDREDMYYDNFLELTDFYIDRGALHCSGEQPSSCEGQTPDCNPMLIDTNHQTFEFAQYSGKNFAENKPDLLKAILTK